MPGNERSGSGEWIFENKRKIKVLALTMEEDDNTAIVEPTYLYKTRLLIPIETPHQQRCSWVSV